jgi:hypothetical protein
MSDRRMREQDVAEIVHEIAVLKERLDDVGHIQPSEFRALSDEIAKLWTTATKLPKGRAA